MVLLASLLELRDQVEHHRHLVDAHAGGRLVEHEDLRLERHQQRDFELALVAVRQRGRRRRRARSPSATRSSTASARAIRSRAVASTAAAGRNARRVGATAPRGARSRARVRLGNRLVSWKARPRPRAGAQRRGKRGDVLAVEQDLPALGAQLAGDQVEVGGLAGAVRADDRGQRAGRETRRSRASTATWPPKRMVRSRVSEHGVIAHRGTALSSRPRPAGRGRSRLSALVADRDRASPRS